MVRKSRTDMIGEAFTISHEVIHSAVGAESGAASTKIGFSLVELTDHLLKVNH